VEGGKTHTKNPPPKAPPSNISSGVTLGVKTPSHLPSNPNRPSSSLVGGGAVVVSSFSYSGPGMMIAFCLGNTGLLSSIGSSLSSSLSSASNL
jgi:hypothetical protein